MGVRFGSRVYPCTAGCLAERVEGIREGAAGALCVGLRSSRRASMSIDQGHCADNKVKIDHLLVPFRVKGWSPRGAIVLSSRDSRVSS
jgi:hypothetical protein